MKFKLMLVTLLITPLMLTACAKKEEAAKSETSTDVAISAEQQAAIDSVDQPDPAAIAIDESVVAAADAENAAAEAAAASGTEVANNEAEAEVPATPPAQ